MRASEIMTGDPACCTPEDSVEMAARVMVAKDCGCLPVVEDVERKRVIGVVTDRDLTARALAEGLGPETSIRDVMSNAPMCCSPEDRVEEIERIMAERQVRRVPVVDDEGLCLGMVAQADLVRNEDATGDSEVRRTIERISEPAR